VDVKLSKNGGEHGERGVEKMFGTEGTVSTCVEKRLVFHRGSTVPPLD